MDKPCIIAIGGGTASGKTTVANELISHFKKKEVRLIRIDDYYKKQDISFEERCKVNYDHPDSIDFDLLLNNLFDLINGNAIDKPVYDFSIHQRSEEKEHIDPSQIILIEGIFALQDERIRELSDIKIYVDTDADTRLIRRLLRDINERGRSLESVINQYQTTVKPMHDAFVEKTKRYADIIIPNDIKHGVAVEVIETKINQLLNK